MSPLEVNGNQPPAGGFADDATIWEAVETDGEEGKMVEITVSWLGRFGDGLGIVVRIVLIGLEHPPAPITKELIPRAFKKSRRLSFIPVLTPRGVL
jgi:hypothetical protein